ncbi:MAG: stalk domain-containing protein [Peptoniphilus sp.]|nr:stalk domain-containing protein [Peptoniphilus sp.]
MKKLFIYTLAFLLVIGNVVMAKEEPVDLKGYEGFYGKVEELADDGDHPQILVANEEGEDKGFEKLYLYTEGVLVLDLKTGEFVEDYKFEKGEMIQYFFRKDTPVLQSLPAKLTPGIIAVNLEDGKYSLDVDTFDKDGHGPGNRLVINVAEDTVAENLKGERVEDFLEKDLLVLYTVATRSLPPITNPDKIIVLEDETKTVDLMDYKAEGEKGFFLRKYYEALGAKVEWNDEEKSTKISLNDKFVDLLNMQGLLTIEDMVIEMKGFSVQDGVSYIPQEYVEKINDFLMK